MIPIIGYTDRLSAAPGDTVAFKISSASKAPYRAKLDRLVSGDPNPESPGMQEVDTPSAFDGEYPSRLQQVQLGSYMRAAADSLFDGVGSFTASATVWPTTPEKPGQGVISRMDAAAGAGFTLAIGPEGAEARIGTGGGETVRIAVGKPLRERRWARVWCAYDSETGVLTVGQGQLQPETGVDDAGAAEAEVKNAVFDAPGLPVLVAAMDEAGAAGCFNGKIERPILHKAARAAEHAFGAQSAHNADVLAAWDFSQRIASLDVVDASTGGRHGRLVNLPARAMVGSNWTGEEMCWRHRPQEYGAIHFHDDDIQDCGWETDFTFELPDGIKSGVYAAKVETEDGGWDHIPFFVRPKPGTRQADLCVVIPTFTYVIYANHARGGTTEGYLAKAKARGARPWTPDTYPDFGLSTYNFHTDGSGICHTTRHRPILNMRPGYISIANGFAVSGLRHLPADLHLIQWLESRGLDYDILTDEDLDWEGVAALQDYPCVLTTSHPEYHTKESLDAFHNYAHKAGGRLLYLGGNGFYWRIARHPEAEGVFEIRRAEGGIRAWAAEPGEYWNAFDGGYGGLWRRNGRPPQQLGGVGFTSQGLFQGSHYRRTEASYAPEHAWIFEGVEEEIVGDFGFSGGGAAGYELDRADPRLGTPPNTAVLASSENHQDHFVLVHEDQLTHVDTYPRVAQTPGGRPEPLIRADMVYFETTNGGAVFSTGSITYCGSLPWNGGDNNISRITENVIRRFLKQD